MVTLSLEDWIEAQQMWLAEHVEQHPVLEEENEGLWIAVPAYLVQQYEEDEIAAAAGWVLEGLPDADRWSVRYDGLRERIEVSCSA